MSIADKYFKEEVKDILKGTGYTLEDLYDSKKYKELNNLLKTVEFDIYLVKAKSDYLLKEIKKIREEKEN